MEVLNILLGVSCVILSTSILLMAGAFAVASVLQSWHGGRTTAEDPDRNDDQTCQDY